MSVTMELPTRNSCAFVNSKLTAIKKKQPIEAANSQRRMVGGADEKTTTNTERSSNKTVQNCFLTMDNVKKNPEQIQPNGRNIQADTTSTLDSVCARLGSEMSTSRLLGESNSFKRTSLGDGPICFCALHSTGSIGDKKVDEMMDYAIQNLNEAEKALNNLGDNFEHDLKLMFMDIMARVQHWVNIVQNRICAAKADLDSLKKESIARVSDLVAKDQELLELKLKLGKAEAKLAEQAMQEKQRIKIPEVADNSGRVSTVRQEKVSTSMQAGPQKNTVGVGDGSQSENSMILANSVCQFRKNQEKTNREAELEAELAQLREEIDRIIEERTEYESAIQHALLKGVSSLNTEALKVLRCSPIPCCTPCTIPSPCSHSPESAPSWYHPRVMKRNVVPQPAQRKSNTVPKKGKNDKIKNRNGGSQQLSEHLLCDGSNRRSIENNMVFLLHNGNAENLCRPCVQPQPCQSKGNSNNRESVCVGGKCKKITTTSTKEKISCVTRSPTKTHPGSSDLCVQSKDDNTSENGTVKKNTVISMKRCEGCSRNQRTRDT